MRLTSTAGRKTAKDAVFMGSAKISNRQKSLQPQDFLILCHSKLLHRAAWPARASRDPRGLETMMQNTNACLLNEKPNQNH